MSIDSDNHKERLCNLVKQVLGTTADLPKPFPVHRQLSELGVTSLMMVNLMLAVEVEFDFEIAQDEITPANFHSVASIQAMIERMLSGRSRRPA